MVSCVDKSVFNVERYLLFGRKKKYIQNIINKHHCVLSHIFEGLVYVEINVKKIALGNKKHITD